MAEVLGCPSVPPLNNAPAIPTEGVTPGAGVNHYTRILTLRGVALLSVLAAPVLILHVGAADLDVYRHGASSMLHQHSLYASSFAAGTRANLPFTYPPFAGVAALPLLPLPETPTAYIWAAATVVMLARCVSVSFRRALHADRPRPDLAVALLTAGFLATRPVYDHLADGQVDIFLMFLCLVDTLAARPRWPRGLLVGLAAAIKLVPGVFIPYLWITGRRKAAAVAGATFLLCEAFAAVVDFGDSRSYWTHLVFNTERPGRTAGYKNQSLRGILLRVLPSQGRPFILGAAAIIIVVAGLAGARLATTRGDALAGATLVGLTGVLGSPVSWIHATVWIIPALGVLVGALTSRARLWTAAVISAALFAGLPYIPNIAHGLSRPIVVLLQRSYGLICLFLLVALPTGRASPQPEPAGCPPNLSVPTK